MAGIWLRGRKMPMGRVIHINLGRHDAHTIPTPSSRSQPKCRLGMAA
jgi:hypothetical protein